jgi:hypothetical protein
MNEPLPDLDEMTDQEFADIMGINWDDGFGLGLVLGGIGILCVFVALAWKLTRG